MKKTVLWTLTLLPALATAAALPFMDERVAMHYNAAGEVNRYGSRYENLIFPCVIVGITLFWLLVIGRFEKKARQAPEEKARAEAAGNAKLLYLTADGMAVLFGAMQCFFLYANLAQSRGGALEMPFDLNVLVGVLLGLFMIVLGNYMPKAKQNSAVGLRTSWTMQSDAVWKVSNRFGGIAFVVCGVLIVFVSLLLRGLAVSLAALGLLLLCTLAAVAYSYRAFQKLEKKAEETRPE